MAIAAATTNSYLQFDANFVQGMNDMIGSGDLVWPSLCQEVDLATRSVEFGFFDKLPGVSEFIGPTTLRSLQERKISVSTKEWRLAFGIPYKDWRDNLLSPYLSLAKACGAEGAAHGDELLSDIIYSNPIGYDGVAFFSASHPWDCNGVLSVQSNLHTSMAASVANLKLGIKMFRMTLKANGKPYGFGPDAVVCTPATEFQFREYLFGSQETRTVNDSTGISITTLENGVRGAISKLIVMPAYVQYSGGSVVSASETDWFLARTSSSIKPWIRVLREPWKFNMLDESSEHCKKNKELQWFTDASYNFAPGFPQLMHKFSA